MDENKEYTAEEITLMSYKIRGTIDLQTMLTTLNTMTKRELEKTYKIKQVTNSSGQVQYYVRVKTSEGKTKQIRKSTYEACFDELAAYIRGQEKESRHIDNLTLSTLYKEWLDYKKTITASNNTILRHEQHFKKYFKGTQLFSMSLSKVDKLTLQAFCNELVKTGGIKEIEKQEPLTRKEWTNIKTILKGMFEYALDKGYIQVNSFERVKITVKYKQVNKKSAKTEIYNTEEYENLHRWLDDMFIETEDLVYLAVKFQSYTGLRVGELVALKWEDVISSTHLLHITKEEVKDKETNHYHVVGHTKTHQDRLIRLTTKAVEVLEKAYERKGQNEFIFTRNHERITSRQIAYVLSKYAKYEGVAVKSSHKLRKTFASRLSDNNVPKDYIRETLGHTSLATTDLYIFSSKTDSEVDNLVNKAV